MDVGTGRAVSVLVAVGVIECCGVLVVDGGVKPTDDSRLVDELVGKGVVGLAVALMTGTMVEEILDGAADALVDSEVGILELDADDVALDGGEVTPVGLAVTDALVGEEVPLEDDGVIPEEDDAGLDVTAVPLGMEEDGMTPDVTEGVEVGVETPVPLDIEEDGTMPEVPEGVEVGLEVIPVPLETEEGGTTPEVLESVGDREDVREESESDVGIALGKLDEGIDNDVDPVGMIVGIPEITLETTLLIGEITLEMMLGKTPDVGMIIAVVEGPEGRTLEIGAVG
jgi:hypothetical protein